MKKENKSYQTLIKLRLAHQLQKEYPGKRVSTTNNSNLPKDSTDITRLHIERSFLIFIQEAATGGLFYFASLPQKITFVHLHPPHQ